MPLPSKKKYKASELTDDQKKVVSELWSASKIGSGNPVESLSPKEKKKKKDPYRITKDDGSGTSGSCCTPCLMGLEDECGDTEIYALAAEKKKPPRPLNKPFRTPKGPKKFSVYVKNDKGNIVKVNFGDPNMEIKRDDPGRRKNFRARHNCDSPGPKWKARYWSCRFWEKSAPVSKLTSSETVTTTEVNGHVHTIDPSQRDGVTSEDHGHTHVYHIGSGGEYIISPVNGHEHSVDMTETID